MFTPITYYAAETGWSFGGTTDGLKFAYEAMGVSDATFTDTSGNGRDGTKSATSGEGITWTEDSDGNYFLLHDLATADTNYVDTGYQPTSVTAYSLDYVFQTNDTSGNAGIRRINGFISDGSATGEQFWARGYGRTEMIWYHDGGFVDGTADGFGFTGITNDTWEHLTVTWNGTQLKGYLNGSLVNTVSFSDSPDFPENLMIHRMPYTARSSAPFYSGTFKIGAITWYEKELNSSEVTANYNYFKQYYTGL